MKALIIGCGYIARVHIEAIRRLGHEVCGVVGRDPGRTRAFASEFGIAYCTTDLGEALAGDADIAHICTPPYDHAETIRACIASGKHVICEKPLCIDPEEASALAAEARAARDEKGLITALCLNDRYYPANLEAARLLREEGREVKVFLGSYLQEFHIPPHPDGWRFDAGLSEGQRAISEIGTHWIDLAYAWTGVRISGVQAELGNWFPARYRKDGMLTADGEGEPVSVATEDTAAVLLRFESGGIGTLLLSETAPGHPNDLSIEVTDLAESCKWEESEPDFLQYSEGGSMERLEFPVADRTSTFEALFREVYAAAEGRTHEPYPTFEDGLYIAKVCAAIRESGQKRCFTDITY